MENILNDVPGCLVYIDDILITGRSDEEHLQNLRQVLNRLQEKGIELKKDKLDFILDKVNYLGFLISSTGLSPIQDKVKAIVEEQQAFIKIKASITSEQVLRHYDLNAPLVLQVDASSIGVRAFMLQPEDGTLKPVAYASRILTISEKKYSQIEKESL